MARDRNKAWNTPRRVRLTDSIDIRKKFLIITEGATEKTYFENYRTRIQPRAIVQIIDGSDNKLSLVQKSIDIRNDFTEKNKYDPSIDETWVVFDRDKDRSNNSDVQNFNAALQLAKDEGLEACYSNDSFELWFLLHFIDMRSALHRKVLNEKLSEKLNRKYEKNTDIYEEIKGMRPDALSRASSILAMHTSNSTAPVDANPSTKVHELVQKLIDQPGFKEN